jgi:hypothetical protein
MAAPEVERQNRHATPWDERQRPSRGWGPSKQQMWAIQMKLIAANKSYHACNVIAVCYMIACSDLYSRFFDLEHTMNDWGMD